jgi:hypothetical protein
MRQAAQEYREGDWFAVPLDDGRYVLGRIARHSNSIVFGYFFAPPFDHVPAPAEIGDRRAADSFIQLRFSCLGLERGDWPVLEQSGQWDREGWPLPEFENRLNVPGRPTVLYAIRLDEKTVSREVSRRRIDPKEAGKRPDESLFGTEAAAIRLRQALSKPH